MKPKTQTQLGSSYRQQLGGKGGNIGPLLFRFPFLVIIAEFMDEHYALCTSVNFDVLVASQGNHVL
jgi:hypothetical protein